MAFDPIEDPAHLDGRRAKMALPPIGVYVCIMRAAYGKAEAAPF